MAAQGQGIGYSGVMNLLLPYPPTVNTYWRNVNGRTILSKRGREYRKEVAAVLPRVQPITDRLAVRILAVMPDRRRRDLDNLTKAVLDSMQHAGVYEDDSQIDSLTIERGPVEKPGRLEIEIEVLTGGVTDLSEIEEKPVQEK